jgi:sterol desaturase/sphingolipid hydroxylase (fatty acid hydroxylase superfamily)
MVLSVAMFAAGLLGWTFLEYVIHGWMAHLHDTFVTPMHAVHHRDARAVFAIGAWLPSIAVAVVVFGFFRFAAGALFYYGLLCGFIGYEVVHYRLHFAAVLTPYERRLRSRHLVHHLRRPMMCLGVVSGFWDRVFGTEPRSEELAALYASLGDVQPLTGPSNFHQLRLLVIAPFRRGYSG